MIRPTLTFVLTILLLVQCGMDKNSETDNQIPMLATESIRLSDYFNDISYTFLEQAPESIFSGADHIVTQGDRWYILDKTLKTVLCFDTSGVFKFRIQRVGRGPGEYARLDGIWLSEDKNRLLLHCEYPSKTMVYNTNGGYIREFVTDRGAMDLVGLPNFESLGYSLYPNGTGRDSVPAGVFSLTAEGKFKEQLFNLGGMFLYWQVSYSRHWSQINDSYYLLSQSDSIVQFDQKGKHKIDCSMNWGKHQMPYNMRWIPTNTKRSAEIFTPERLVWKDHLLVTGSLRWFHCAIGNNYFYAMIDKATRKGQFTQSISNDINSLPAPFPIAQSGDSELIGFMDMDLIWAIKEALTNQEVPSGKEAEIRELQQFINKAISIDRPVMVRYHLKDKWRQ